MTHITIEQAEAQQILDALKTAHAQTCSVGRPKDWQQLSDAITAIKQALAAPVQEPVACQVCGGSGFIKCDALQSREKNHGKWGRCLSCRPYTTPPKQPAPVQPVGVATGCASHEGFFTVVFRSSQPIPDGTGLYTTPPAQPAPVQPVRI